MRLRNAWAVACVLAAYVATFACIKCDAGAGDSSDVSATIRYQANISAGGVNPAGVVLENPHKDDRQSAQTGERLFSAMNCDGCHGGGALGWVGPSLVDGRWRYGGADEEIFHSIFYGRPKGMPAYGGVLGSEGTWMIITYLKSQPTPNVVPTTLYEDLATTATPDTNVPTSLVALQPALPATGAEGMLAKYGCVACHTVEKKIVGPAFKDVAAKYRAQTGAAAYLAVQVKNGSTGVWGMIPCLHTPMCRLLTLTRSLRGFWHRNKGDAYIQFIKENTPNSRKPWNYVKRNITTHCTVLPPYCGLE